MRRNALVMLVIVGARAQTLAVKTGQARIIRPPVAFLPCPWPPALKPSLHSPHRQLIELRMEHADLDALIDRCTSDAAPDELTLRRLKKRRLVLRDAMERLERQLEPQEPA